MFSQDPATTGRSKKRLSGVIDNKDARRAFWFPCRMVAMRRMQGGNRPPRTEQAMPQKEDAGLSARIPPPRRFGWGDSNRRDLRLGSAYIIQ